MIVVEEKKEPSVRTEGQEKVFGGEARVGQWFHVGSGRKRYIPDVRYENFHEGDSRLPRRVKSS